MIFQCPSNYSSAALRSTLQCPAPLTLGANVCGSNRGGKPTGGEVLPV